MYLFFNQLVNDLRRVDVSLKNLKGKTMSIHVYDENRNATAAKYLEGAFEFYPLGLSQVELLPLKVGPHTRVTAVEKFCCDEGFNFEPGRYQGEGFEVTITARYMHYSTHGKVAISKPVQDFSGKFDSWDIMLTFWKLLREGQLLPIAPVSSKPDLRLESYARQAALVVGLSARIRDLETSLKQMQHHIDHQGQIIQELLLNK